MASQVFDEAVILAALTVVTQDEEGVDINCKASIRDHCTTSGRKIKNVKAIKPLKHTLLDAGYLTIKLVPRKAKE